MDKMKIMITGGGGYVGSVLTQKFLEENHNVVVLDILRRGSQGIVSYKGNSKFMLYNADFCQKSMLEHIFKVHEPEIVIHLAAIVGDKECEENKELATKTNVEGVRTLIDVINEYDIPMFITSTSSIYGSNPNVCDEETIPFPISHYANTKLEMEYLVKNKAKYALIFRFGTMYGWSPCMRFDLVVNKLVYDAVRSSEHIFKIFGGKQCRPFLHPLDLANFFMSLFDKDLYKFNGEIFNLVSENLSMLELGELIEKVIPTSKMELLPVNQVERTYICRSYKAYRDLGFSPLIRVRDGIQEIEKKLNGGYEL